MLSVGIDKTVSASADADRREQRLVAPKAPAGSLDELQREYWWLEADLASTLHLGCMRSSGPQGAKRRRKSASGPVAPKVTFEVVPADVGGVALPPVGPSGVGVSSGVVGVENDDLVGDVVPLEAFEADAFAAEKAVCQEASCEISFYMKPLGGKWCHANTQWTYNRYVCLPRSGCCRMWCDHFRWPTFKSFSRALYQEGAKILANEWMKKGQHYFFIWFGISDDLDTFT